ncbi:DNA circularization N-terminal domain-containing protein [Salinarimonas sp.]|uniref:DNA circularization N-terminal domain-containing protein n=1 Tax=Salinarimonas sp. TaxID=2766526 RepID=UPI003918CD1A
MSWRNRLRAASFRGVPFHVEEVAQSGGRSLVEHDFPKRDEPYFEDMRRQTRRMVVVGYTIGPLYDIQRSALVAACEAEGPGTLVHPTLGEILVRCEFVGNVERREDGGFAQIDMTFVEAGGDPGPTTSVSTAGLIETAARAAVSAIVGALNGALR